MALPLGASLAIGSAVPAIASYFGQKGANRANRKMAREQMAFQERMSSTAYQRSMADMRKAGVNPMLAFQQGGASSPGGATARIENELEPAVSSAKGGVMMRSELKSMEQSRELMYNQARAAQAAGNESAAREQLVERNIGIAEIQSRILELQMPALINSAAVESTRLLGRGGAAIDRIRQMFLGGRGFFNPIGGGR